LAFGSWGYSNPPSFFNIFSKNGNLIFFKAFDIGNIYSIFSPLPLPFLRLYAKIVTTPHQITKRMNQTGKTMWFYVSAVQV